jgi:hypothetical protein
MATTAASRTRRRTAATDDAGPRTATVRLPRLAMSMPRGAEVGAAVRNATSRLPEPKKALYYGGLAALAALELVEWPVVAAIGLGTVLAGGKGRDEQPDSSGKTSTADA